MVADFTEVLEKMARNPEFGHWLALSTCISLREKCLL